VINPSQTTLARVGDASLLGSDALADRAALQDVVFAFALHYDNGDFAELNNLLTADAEYIVEPAPPGMPPLVSTRERITAGIELVWRHNHENLHLVQRHVITNVLVTGLDTDAPEARSVLTVTTLHSDGSHTVSRTGSYTDKFRREGDRWRIAHRLLRLATPETPTPGAG
jgi:3-phenylpropionate/cinnamic acid dioxygenase small subunit